MNYVALVRKYPNFIGYGALHYFFSSWGQTFLISLFVPHFMEAMGLTNMQFGWVYSGATLTSALILPWMGGLLDKIKLRYISLLIGGLLSIFCLIAAFIWHPAVLFVALIGLRLFGQGMLPLTASTAIARYFEINRGKALSLSGFGVSAGEFILPLLLVGVIGMIGWQNTWIILALSVLVIFIPLSVSLVPASSPFQQNPISDIDHDENAGISGRSLVLKDPKFYGLVLVYLFIPFFCTGIIIQQSAIAAHRSWSAELMAWGISVFGLARLTTNLLAGPLVDRYTAVKVFPFILIPLMLGTSILAIGTSPMTALAFFASCGISNGLSSLSATAMWAEVYGTRHYGSIRSLVSTVMVFSTAIAPAVLAWSVADENRMELSFWAGVLIMGVLTLMAFAIVRKIVKLN